MVTKEKFLEYEKIRKSGRTNMFGINTVILLSNGRLTRDDCFEIMDNYDTFKKEWLEE